MHNGIPVRLPGRISHAIPVGVCEREDGIEFDFDMKSTTYSRHVLRSGNLSISYCVYQPSDGTNECELLFTFGLKLSQLTLVSLSPRRCIKSQAAKYLNCHRPTSTTNLVISHRDSSH